MDEQDVPGLVDITDDHWSQERVLARKTIAWDREKNGVMSDAQLSWERRWFIRELSAELEYRKAQVREVELKFDWWADKENKWHKGQYPTSSTRLELFHPAIVRETFLPGGGCC